MGGGAAAFYIYQAFDSFYYGSLSLIWLWIIRFLSNACPCNLRVTYFKTWQAFINDDDDNDDDDDDDDDDNDEDDDAFGTICMLKTDWEGCGPLHQTAMCSFKCNVSQMQCISNAL